MKRLLLPMLLILFIMGCDKEQTTSENPLTGVSAKAKAGKVDVCHNGMIINVNGNSVSAHQAHGDAIDMDGDGFFDIDNSCSITDCDDGNAQVNELCCPEFIEVTVNNEAEVWDREYYSLADGESCSGKCVTDIFSIGFSPPTSPGELSRYNLRGNTRYYLDYEEENFCEISCYSGLRKFIPSAEPVSVDPKTFILWFKDADSNEWIIEYLSETESGVTFRYRQITDCD